MLDDPALVEQIGPHLPGKAEVGGAVAVQMADLAATDPERELTAPSRSCLDARPRRDLSSDPLAG